MSEITNTQDYIDSRDIQERIDELQKNKCDDEEQAELDSLIKLKDLYVSDYGDGSWGYGASLIRDDYFEEYARETADSCGYVDHRKVYDWPFNHIDWVAAADSLKDDYTEIDFDGVTYYTREA